MATKIRLWQEGSFVCIKARGLPLERFKDFREAIGGARYVRERGYNMAPFDKVATILRRLREAHFDTYVEPDLVRSLQEYSAQQWLDLQAAQERVKRIDEELAKKGLRLYPFQRTGVQWLATRYGALLADEMGLGKTIQAIAAIPAMVPVLVVAPAVAKGVWVREVAKWRPHLRVSILKGRDSFRWPERGEMLVTNYDILPEIHKPPCKGFLPAKQCPGGCKTEVNSFGVKVKADGHADDCNERGNLLPPEECPGCANFLRWAPEDCTVVVDEAHNVKSLKARRTKRFRAVSEAVRKNRGRVWLLTATPLLNHPQELWGVYQAAGIATEAFGDWRTFVHLFKGKSLFFGGYEWGTPEAEVAERIRRVQLRRLRLEVLPELPTKTHRTITVDVDKAALSECESFLKEHGGLERVLDLIEGEGIKFETMSRVRAALAKAKTASLMKLVDEWENQTEDPLVVFSAHRFPIDLLKKRKGWQVITGDTSAEERTAIEDQFQRGELRGVACTIKAGGVAITLTRAYHAIFVDREFTPALNAQAEDRVCRIGQSRGVLITTLAANHQLDERVLELVLKKQALINASIDAAAENDNSVIDAELTRKLEEEAKELRGSRAARHPAMSDREKWANDNLHKLPFNPADLRIVMSLCEEADTIGLSDKQWELAIRICKNYPDAGKCPGEVEVA